MPSSLNPAVTVDVSILNAPAEELFDMFSIARTS
jgi:hypothetical protein